MAMKAMKVAMKDNDRTAMQASMKSKKAMNASPKKQVNPMNAMKAKKYTHTTWTYVNVKNIPSLWVRIDHDQPKVQVTCYKELAAMVAIK